MEEKKKDFLTNGKNKTTNGRKFSSLINNIKSTINNYCANLKRNGIYPIYKWTYNKTNENN